MNESESKTDVLYSSIYKILKDDNTNTAKTVREIEYHVADRIIRSNLRHNLANPKILMEVIESQTNLTLSTEKYMLILTVVVDMDMTYALTVLDNISARVEFLINKKPVSINLAYSSKNLRCRLINKTSGITSTDALKMIHQKHIMFDVVLDDEVIEC